MNKPIKNPPLERDICGTKRGAVRHRYHKEEVCEPCRVAFNAHYAKYHRQHRAANPDKLRKLANDAYKRDPSKQRKASNKWRAKNMDKQRKYMSNWREENRGKINDYQKSFRQTDKGKELNRKSSRVRRARKRQTQISYYTEQQILNLHGTNCHLCDKPIDMAAPRSQAQKLPGWEKGLQFDHVIPLAKGGPDTIENVKPSHAICNLRKSDNLLL